MTTERISYLIALKSRICDEEFKEKFTEELKNQLMSVPEIKKVLLNHELYISIFIYKNDVKVNILSVRSMNESGKIISPRYRKFWNMEKSITQSKALQKISQAIFPYDYNCEKDGDVSLICFDIQKSDPPNTSLESTDNQNKSLSIFCYKAGETRPI